MRNSQFALAVSAPNVHDCEGVRRSDLLCGFGNVCQIEIADDARNKLIDRRVMRAIPSSGRVILMGSFILMRSFPWRIIV